MISNSFERIASYELWNHEGVSLRTADTGVLSIANHHAIIAHLIKGHIHPVDSSSKHATDRLLILISLHYVEMTACRFDQGTDQLFTVLEITALKQTGDGSSCERTGE